MQIPYPFLHSDISESRHKQLYASTGLYKEDKPVNYKRCGLFVSGHLFADYASLFVRAHRTGKSNVTDQIYWRYYLASSTIYQKWFIGWLHGRKSANSQPFPQNLKLEHVLRIHSLLHNSGYGVRRKCKDVVSLHRTKVLLAHPKEVLALLVRLMLWLSSVRSHENSACLSPPLTRFFRGCAKKTCSLPMSSSTSTTILPAFTPLRMAMAEWLGKPRISLYVCCSCFSLQAVILPHLNAK